MSRALRLALATGWLALTAIPVSAQVKIRTDATLRQFCSDADDSKHTRKTTLEHFVLIDDFAAFDSVRLLLDYDPEQLHPSGRGRVSARVQLLRADGSSRKLGRLRAVQDRVTGGASAIKVIDEPLNPGDVLSWSFKFTKFPRLDAGQCFAAAAGVSPPADACGPYPNQATSDYVLPYHPGETSVISQGNCTHGSHKGPFRYAYDFVMPMGTEILAVRAGTVVDIEQSRPDGTFLGEDDNHLDIEHDDGSHSRYVHMTQNGVLVAVGDRVEQGQPVALSGNSGATGGLPHLHFLVYPCADRFECGTSPITFRNTKAHPRGLQMGQAYTAR